MTSNALINAARSGSVMRWGHFNFNGEYDFSDEKMTDSIGLSALKKGPLRLELRDQKPQ